MTRYIKWAAAAVLGTFLSIPALAAPATPVGSWQVSTGEARYVVTACGEAGELCAKLVWLHPDNRTAENIALLDQWVVRGAERASVNSWSGNLLFEGESYAGTMTLVSTDTMTLKGCSGMLCKTFRLVRV
jgi:uncharacterized protein (DUF2147 family)